MSYKGDIEQIVVGLGDARGSLNYQLFQGTDAAIIIGFEVVIKLFVAYGVVATFWTVVQLVIATMDGMQIIHTEIHLVAEQASVEGGNAVRTVSNDIALTAILDAKVGGLLAVTRPAGCPQH